MVKNTEKYDIFISYRRDGAEALACLLSEKLRQLGFSVFYDVESLRSGKFNDKLYEAIENCKDIILVLPQNGLERCNDVEDWVRKEIVHGIKYRKNIVPVFMREFDWPKKMPEELSCLRQYNGLTANMEYFDATFEKLLKLLSVAQKRTFLNREYWIVYYTFSPFFKKKKITSKLKIDQAAHVTLYDNVKNKRIDTADYTYHGVVMETDNNIYMHLSNDASSEMLYIVLTKGAGRADRFIGMVCGLSNSMLPVCFKCVCVSDDIINHINNSVLEMVLEHSNKEWNDNLLAVESVQVNMFFSENFIQENCTESEK